jgi:hypothetical protein
LIRPRCISRCQPIFAPDAARRTCFSFIGARRERGCRRRLRRRTSSRGS